MRPQSLRAAIPIIIIVVFAWNFFFKKEIAQPLKTSSVSASVELCFTPGENCTERIVQKIAQTQKNIRIQAYSFTSAPIAQALVEAQKRGIDIKIILDDSQEKEKYSSLDFFLHSNISTAVDKAHAIAHNKIMILDEQSVVTGSFNFTKAAEERNAENVVFLNDTKLAEDYLENWIKHAQHSQPPRLAIPKP